MQAVFVEGGVAGNVVPDAAVAVVNHRFAPDRSVDDAGAHVRDLLAPAMDGDDPRSGRWVGSEKTECGLHL